MSERLTVSAMLSVLMMSIFVLFGSGVSRLPLGPEQLAAHHAAQTAGLPADPSHLLISSH